MNFLRERARLDYPIVWALSVDQIVQPQEVAEGISLLYSIFGKVYQSPKYLYTKYVYNGVGVKMKTITLKELIGNWFVFKRDVSKCEVLDMDFDEIMNALGVFCPEAETSEQTVVVSDFDATTYEHLAVAFSFE